LTRADRDTLFSAIGTESNALETTTALGVVQTETEVAADGGVAATRVSVLTNRGVVRAGSIDAGAPFELTGAFMAPVIVDVCAARREAGTVRVLVTGAIDANAELGGRVGFADVTLRAVERVRTRDPPIHAGAPLAGEARRAIVALIHRVTARRHAQAELSTGAHLAARVVTRIRTIVHGGARAGARLLTLTQGAAARRRAPGWNADVARKGAIIVGRTWKARKGVGRAGVAERVRHAGTADAREATGATASHHAARPAGSRGTPSSAETTGASGASDAPDTSSTADTRASASAARSGVEGWTFHGLAAAS